MTTTIDLLCARVFLGLREDRLGTDDVVELACALMDSGHGGDAVREAVERDPRQVSPAELAASAAGILAEAGYEPGFDLVPERLDILRQAQRIVARDLGTAWSEDEPEPSGLAFDDLPATVAAMAEHVQCGRSERTWTVWPVCTEHRLGVHAVVMRDVAVWRCVGGGGHTLAPVGSLITPTDAASPR
ncbi:hypothetical protein KDL01_22760 [Actinospica durhamensis]|uniref:Uncharacterized protein n=1 Tax=Actinospica durhamensis TaxID=1508375 RepID=A0A941ERP6_9ACTN|nr:hypothetical protein [Actinospica durhamensis]MBR7836116.1 hypothetical protein [Actinospica durhamensis]